MEATDANDRLKPTKTIPLPTNEGSSLGMEVPYKIIYALMGVHLRILLTTDRLLMICKQLPTTCKGLAYPEQA